MADVLLILGVVFTIIYIITFIGLIIAGCTSGIEGQDGALCVCMGLFIVIALPLMWLFFTGDIPDSSSDAGFWIFATLPLWLLPWAIYLCFTNGTCGTSAKQILCCGCCG